MGVEGAVPAMPSPRNMSLCLRARRMVTRRMTREARVALMARRAGIILMGWFEARRLGGGTSQAVGRGFGEVGIVDGCVRRWEIGR
jgi:hypothetical protein